MKKSGVAIALAIGALAILAFLSIIAAVYFLATRSTGTRTPDAHAGRLVVSSAALQDLGVEIDPVCGKLTSINALGFMREVKYEHDCDEQRVYVESTAEMHLTGMEARQSYLMNITGMRAGLAATGTGKLVPREDLAAGLGDQRYAALFTFEGRPGGNVLVLRQGRIVHRLLITGAYFDDHEDVRQLMTPLLEESKRRQQRR